MHKLLQKFPGLAASGHPNSMMIVDCQKFTTKLTMYGMSSFHYYHLNQSFPLAGRSTRPMSDIKTNSMLQC